MALSDNLVAYWSLDEASGTRVDAHGSNDLTDNSTVASGTGIISNAADFDSGASSESLSRADNADLSTGDIDYTLAMWVKPETFAVDNPHIAAKINDAATTLEYQLFYHTATSRYRWIVFDGSSGVGDVSANNFGAPGTGAWHFIVVSHSTSNQVSICVNDGTPNTAATTGAPADTNANFTIGMLSPGFTTNGQWNGLIDEFGFWKRVLSGAEITELYNAGAGRDYAYITAAGGRTTKNTRSHPLGMRLGMNWRVCG